MTAELSEAALRRRLLRFRLALALSGLAAGALLALAFWPLAVPCLLPLLAFLAWPEVATGLWLWWLDPRRGRGLALLLGYAAWGLLRWAALGTAVLLVGTFVLGLYVSAAMDPTGTGDHPLPASVRAAFDVLVPGAFLSAAVALGTGLVLQILAMVVGGAIRARTYINPAVVRAYLRRVYPPPLPIEFALHTSPVPAIALVSGVIGVLGCFISCTSLLFLVVNLEMFLRNVNSPLGALASFATIPVGIGIGFAASYGCYDLLDRWFRPPTPYDCWGTLYAGSVLESRPDEDAPARRPAPTDPAALARRPRDRR